MYRMRDLFSDSFQMLDNNCKAWLRLAELQLSDSKMQNQSWAQSFVCFSGTEGAPASNGLLHCFAQHPGGVQPLAG